MSMEGHLLAGDRQLADTSELVQDPARSRKVTPAANIVPMSL